MNDLVTGEAVPLEVRLAKLPSRALSFTLDALLLAALAIGVMLLLGQIVPDVDQALATALVISCLVFVLVVVPTTIETLTRGKSLGKLALGLRAVRDDGGAIRFRHALVRALAGVFADFVITVGLGAVLCSLLNSQGKRIGDVMAGTIVVRERIPSMSTQPPSIDPSLAGWARGLELSQLPDGLAMAARTLLARSPELAPDIRERLAADLATQISEVVSPAPPPGTPAPAYLSTVLGERRRRATQGFASDARSRPPGTETPPAPPSRNEPPEGGAEPPGGEAEPPGGGAAPHERPNDSGFQPPA